MAHHHHHHHHQESIAQQHQQQNLLDVLYCSEEHWEEELGEDYFHEEDEVEDNSYGNSNEPSHFSDFLEQDLFWDDGELNSLFSKEQQNELYENLKTDSCLVEARRKAVEWMMKVNAHYSFSALTAVLAVNYFDRFLLSFHFHGEKPWMPQLAAVGCLSLAAKVEETQVPLMLDLQVEDCKYVFEAKTIKRMEILVLSTLQWKMNPVTPFSFLDYIIRRLGSKDHRCWEFLRRCERVLLCVLADYRFLSYLPSVVATATMLHVVSTLEPCLVVEHQNQLLGILGIEKDRVDDCYKLIAEWASEGHGGRNLPTKRKFCSIPGSPKGVNDVSFSSDSSNDSWALAVPLVSSSPQPLSKKSRAQDQLLQMLNKSDFRSTASNTPPTRKKNRTGLIVGITVGGLIKFLAVLCILQKRKRRHANKNEELLGIDAGLYTFSYSELKTATEDFSTANKLGEGGFGPVYKGT